MRKQSGCHPSCGSGAFTPLIRGGATLAASSSSAADGPAPLGGAAAVVCSRTRGAALPTDPLICNARVPRAIGQSFDWFVPAEAEVLGARVVDRPATFRLAELEQRTSASVVDRDVFSRRLRPPERHHQHLMLGEDVQARTLRAPSPWSLGARKPCGTPLLQLPADHILGP